MQVWKAVSVCFEMLVVSWYHFWNMDTNRTIKQLRWIKKSLLSWLFSKTLSERVIASLTVLAKVAYLLKVCRNSHFLHGQIKSEFPTWNNLYFIPILKLIFFLSLVNPYQKCIVFLLFTIFQQIIFKQNYWCYWH